MALNLMKSRISQQYSIQVVDILRLQEKVMFYQATSMLKAA